MGPLAKLPLVLMGHAGSQRCAVARAGLLLYGMRRGQALGLRWADIDFDDHMIHVRQQIHLAQGQMQIGPVKTRAGSRDLPCSAWPKADRSP